MSSEALDLATRAQSVAATLASVKADPQRFFAWGVGRLRPAFNLFTEAEPISELHLRASNKGGKTLSKAHFVLECLKKGHELDGVRIPQWSGPVEALQLVLDYQQQLLSVKPAYLKALGGWPAKVAMQGEYLKSIRVMPRGGNPNDMADWSVIHFMSQKNPDSGKGARADLIDFDEPPKMEFLDELRKAGHAGRRSIRIIGETPLKRREWAPLRVDYGDSPRSTIRRVDRYRAECRWSLHEVADWVLSQAEKDELLSDWRRRPLGAAREHGDYENVDGSCPFDAATLELMIKEWARDPVIQHVRASVESIAGVTKTTERVGVQIYAMPVHGHDYYIVIDPASGVDDNDHNPLGIHVYDETDGSLVCRWVGYLAPYTVGSLAAALHRHYNGAACDIEMNDHWGPNVVRGYTDSDGGNLCYSQRELSPGVFAKEVGFHANGAARALWIGVTQAWIEAFRVGAPYAPCPSREVLDCILAMEIDAKDRIVAGPGIAHAEDAVLNGQHLVRFQRPYHVAPAPYVTARTENDRLVAMIRGEDEDDYEPEPGLLIPRANRPGW